MGAFHSSKPDRRPDCRQLGHRRRRHNGDIDVFASGDTDMIIDIAGYFTDNANVSNLAFYPVMPCRVVDSRSDYSNAPAAAPFAFRGAPNARVYAMTISAVSPTAAQRI